MQLQDFRSLPQAQELNSFLLGWRGVINFMFLLLGGTVLKSERMDHQQIIAFAIEGFSKLEEFIGWMAALNREELRTMSCHRMVWPFSSRTQCIAWARNAQLKPSLVCAPY